MKAPISVQNIYSIFTPSTDEDSLEIVVTNSDQGIKNKPYKTRRGFNKNQHVKRQSAAALKVLPTICAGVGGKLSSLKSEVKHAAANLVILQETHSKRRGKIQFPNMVVFEAILSLLEWTPTVSLSQGIYLEIHTPYHQMGSYLHQLWKGTN